MMSTWSARSHRLRCFPSAAILAAAISLSSAADAAITREYSYVEQQYGLTSGESELVQIEGLNDYSQTIGASGSVVWQYYSSQCQCTVTEIYDASASSSLDLTADLLAGTVEGSGQYHSTADDPSFNQGSARSSIDYRFSVDQPYYFVLHMTASAGAAANGIFWGASIVDPSMTVDFDYSEEAVDLVRHGILEANPGNTQNGIYMSIGPGCETGCIGDPSGAFAFSLRLVPVPEPTPATALPIAVLAVDWLQRRRHELRARPPRSA